MATSLSPPRPRRSLLQLELTPKKIKRIELMNFCRFLSVFLTAGIPILDALDVIRLETPDKKLREVLLDLSTALRSGDSLSGAIALHEKSFPSYFVSTIRSAEETGQVAAVLGQMALYLERDIEAKRRIKSALTYPAVVVLLSIVSIVILVWFVLPRFVTFFKEYNSKLPLPTRILVSVSHFFVEFGILIAIIIVGLALIIGAGTLVDFGRMWRDRVVLKIPLVGKVVSYSVVERFCRIMAAMVTAGVPLPVALDLAANGAGNRWFASKIELARRQMIQGAGLHQPLAATDMFPSAAIQMLRVGEDTGTLPQRLEDISEFYGKELQYRLKRLTDLLEPAAVITVGIIVGFVAVAIISAIYGVFNGTNLK